jgi:hypothetical protein
LEQRIKPFPICGPGLITFFKEGRIVYKVTKNRDGTIHVRRWVTAPVPMGQMELPSLDFDPFEMVAVYFKFGEDVLGGSKGSVVYMPATNLLLLENKQFKRDMELAINVGMVFGGGFGAVRAAGRLALTLAIAEAAVGAANITIDNYKSELEKTPEGAAFLRSWEVVHLLFAAYWLGRAVRSAPRALRELRDAFRAFQGARGNIDPATAARVEAEMAGVLRQTDEVEKAIVAEAQGDAAAAETSLESKVAEVPEKLPPFPAPTRPSKPVPTPEEYARVAQKDIGAALKAAEELMQNPGTIYNHEVRQGGLGAIAQSSTLEAGGGTSAFGGGDAVRAHFGSAKRTTKFAVIEFQTSVKGSPRPYIEGVGATWNSGGRDSPIAGELPIKIVRIRFPDGRIATPGSGGQFNVRYPDGTLKVVDATDLE